MERVPVTIRFGLPLLALGILVWLGWSWWVHSHATLVVRVPGGGDAPSVVLGFYADELSSAAPSPPPFLGELVARAGERVRVGSDLVPESALVRVEPSGYGVGFTVLHLGEEPAVFEAQPPGRLEGMVRSGEAPVPGARVVLLGGGSRGVPLVETATDDSGRFLLEGFDSTLPQVTVRVLHAGHAVVDVHRWRELVDELSVDLVPTRPIEGRVLLPPSLAADDLLVVARSVPGAHVSLDADGSFELDHVPPDVHASLLVFGLPREWTHGPAKVQPGQEGVEIEVVPATTVSGVVVDAATGVPIPSAFVFHLAGPSGVTGADCAADGTFTLGDVPPGTIRITAQVPIPGAPPDQRQFRSSHRTVPVEEGEPLSDIVIRVP